MNNLHKDLPDSRDLTFAAGTFPPSFSLKQYVSRVENQGTLNSCTNEAVAMMMEMLLKKFRPARYAEMSRTFVWWFARIIDGKDGQNVGVYPRSVVKALEQNGICPEKFWASTIPDRPPDARAIKQATPFKIKSYQRCVTVEQIKTAISSGFPVFVAMRLRDDFGKGTWVGEFIGGHAMVIVGYTTEHAEILNSWGGRWSGDGCIEIPWTVLMADGYDFWAITGIKNWFDRALLLMKGLFK